MPTAKGFDPHAEPETWPSYIRSILEADEDRSWKADARCIDNSAIPAHYWVVNACDDEVVEVVDGQSWKMRDVAAAQCWVCRAQWDCVQFAIDTGDKWNVSGGTPAERKVLKTRKDWRDLVEMSRGTMSIHDLVLHMIEVDKKGEP